MAEERTVKLSIRLDSDVFAAIEEIAKDKGFEPMAYIQYLLTDHASESGRMTPHAAERVRLTNEIIAEAVARSRELYPQIFDEHFTLNVFRHLIKDDSFRGKYEKVIGGKANELGLPGKSPLNMYLGWYIKNAVGADPKTGPDGKPMRAQVRNEPIQSYTLLKEGQRPSA